VKKQYKIKKQHKVKKQLFRNKLLIFIVGSLPWWEMLLLLSLNFSRHGLWSWHLKPDFIFPVVFFWVVFARDLRPSLTGLIALGLIADLLSAGPFGLETFSLMFFVSVCSHAKKYLADQPYITVWGVFGLVLLLTITVKWFASSLRSGGEIGFVPILLAGFTVFFSYPPLMFLNARLEARMIKSKEALS